MGWIDNVRAWLGGQPDEPTLSFERNYADAREAVDNLQGAVRDKYEVIAQGEAIKRETDNFLNDPRLYDSISNEAQFGAPEADRLERANPSVPEEAPFEVDEYDRPEGDPRNIELVETSGWQSLDGLWESRTSLGKSEEGWHHSVETAYQGGDGTETGWSQAYPSQEEAMHALHEAHGLIMAPHEQEAEEREEREIREHEKGDARMIDDIIREVQERRRQEIDGGIEL